MWLKGVNRAQDLEEGGEGGKQRKEKFAKLEATIWDTSLSTNVPRRLKWKSKTILDSFEDYCMYIVFKINIILPHENELLRQHFLLLLKSHREKRRRRKDNKNNNNKSIFSVELRDLKHSICVRSWNMHEVGKKSHKRKQRIVGRLISGRS